MLNDCVISLATDVYNKWLNNFSNSIPYPSMDFHGE